MKAVAKAPVTAPSEREVRDQIERITSSTAFRTSDRLKHFITFVASQVLQGKGDNLKEYAVGVQVFGRETAFDPRTDPVVRVQARRLRARLESYYREEGQHDDIVVDLPKGGYAPVFRRRAVAAPPKSIVFTAPQENTVAVSPIADLSSDQTLERFCSGLTREIVRRLASVKGLRVATSHLSSGSSAAMAVEGSINQASEGFRLTANLVNQGTGCYERCEAIDVPSVDTFAVQDSIADALVSRLQPFLTSSRASRRHFAN